MTEFLQTSDIFETLPYTILSMGAFVILMLSLFWKKQENITFFWCVSVLIAVGAFLSLFHIGTDVLPMGGLLIHNEIGFPFAFIVLVTLMMVLPILPYESKALNENPSAVTSLLLLGACGALMMIYANHLLTFFIGLELLSLPLYVLTGIGSRKGQSSEASFKYFLLGSISSAVFIYGASLIWAALGTLQINEIVQIYSANLVDYSSTTLWMGTVLIVSSLLFKLGAFPFHFWIPDVYQAAPSSIVAWMSSATKSATIVLLLRVLEILPAVVQPMWILPLSLVAVGSMVCGSFGALFQTNARRMLGYSTIAHVGYALIAVVCVIGEDIHQASSILAFYFLAYGVASLIAFTIISSEEENGNIVLKDFAGMAQRSPGKAFCLALSLLSLAGLPPLGGFIGKFNVFYRALEKGHGPMVVIAVLTSLVSLGYYLNFLVKIYMEPGKEAKPNSFFATSVMLGVAVVFLIVLGIFPKPIFELFQLMVQ